jgi:hypothetical protein
MSQFIFGCPRCGLQYNKKANAAGAQAWRRGVATKAGEAFRFSGETSPVAF